MKGLVLLFALVYIRQQSVNMAVTALSVVSAIFVHRKQDAPDVNSS